MLRLAHNGQTAERTMTPAGRSVFKTTLSATPACPGGQTGTSHARRSIAREGTARRARGPPVRYRDKPDPKPQTLKPEWKTFLTPAARLKNEERLSRSEQRTGNKPKPPLDRKSPIQVRILLPQRRVREPSVPPAISASRLIRAALARMSSAFTSSTPP